MHEGAGHDSPRRLDCPLTVIAAGDDDLPAAAVWAWRGYTTRHAVRQVRLPGAHFHMMQTPHAQLACLRSQLPLRFGPP